MKGKNNQLHHFFTAQLMKWNEYDNNRQMPWKFEKDPYKIWLSEIILQQTRVEQGLAYYNRFILNYPTIKKLAAADEAAVFKHWEGLGYYSRCRNLLATAKTIVEKYDGVFPSNYEDIVKLKGIGPYTAAAIASFAFNLSFAVVDGNVTRILARFFGMETPIDIGQGKKAFSELADTLLDSKYPAKFNQAIMDFGATICKPKSPLCATCPLAKNCFSFKNEMTAYLPVKSKKIIKKERWFYYLIVQYKNYVLIRKRNEKDIWRDLHEFVLIETLKKESLQKINNSTEAKYFSQKAMMVKPCNILFKQQLTHQVINASFIEMKITEKLPFTGYFWVNKKEIKNWAFPKLTNDFLKENNF